MKELNSMLESMLNRQSVNKNTRKEMFADLSALVGSRDLELKKVSEKF